MGTDPYGHYSKYNYDNQHRIIFEQLRNMTVNPFHPDRITYMGTIVVVTLKKTGFRQNDISMIPKVL